MKTAIINGRIITPEGVFENGYIVFEDGIITDVSAKHFAEKFDGNIIDAQGKYVSPGFIDLHVHGGFQVC